MIENVKFCKKCKQITPHSVIAINGKECCVVCGTEHENNKKRNNINQALIDYCKIDPDSGTYKNAMRTGRNVLIGLALIIGGILYAVGGLALVITIAIATIIVIFFLAVLLWFIAMVLPKKK